MASREQTLRRHDEEVRDGRQPARPAQFGTETRRSLSTSEFWVAIVAGAAVVIASYADKALDVETGWALFAAIIVGYLLSRGIAKAGSRETYVRDIDIR